MRYEPAALPRLVRPGGERRGAADTRGGAADERGGSPALARALDLAAEVWGAGRSWLLPHGTQCDVAACLAVRIARGRQVVVQRDAGAGVTSGLIAAGLAPHWLAPEIDPIAGVAHGVTPAALDAALTGAPGARAAIVVAPAFHGAVPDVAALAAVAHGHGAALVVDESRGAHLPFHPALPTHAIAAGADLVATGPAMLHQGPLAERWLPAATIERAVALCAPDAAGDAALAALGAVRARAIDGERLLAAALHGAAAARAQLTGIPGVRVLGPELAGSPGVHGFDPLRLTVDLQESRRDARTVAAEMRELAGIELALATDRLLVCALGTGDRELGLAERFATALLDTLWTVPPLDGPADVVATLRAVVAAGGVVRGSADGLETFGVVD